ncbi:hypothetical protein FO519_004138 [Halicephalobus sp. NKZ332]|nr:hypothetical protein FO519_004138 [Halicephalobus sp. NKZ332]
MVEKGSFENLGDPNFEACGTKNEDLATCQKTIEKWIKIKNSRFHLDGLRMFIERRNIGSMDEDVVKKVNQIFLEKFPENEGRHVIKELDFFIDPVGIFTKNKMDSEMKEATCGRISEVVKKDLVPDWRARLTLSVASDESFFWKTLSEPVISKAYFYDSYDKQACNRIYTKTIKAKCKVRRKVFKDIEIIELFSSNDESLIVLIPLKQKLSCSFLKEITAKKIVQYINMLPKEKTTSEIILPVISISFPLGLRAVFEKPHFEKRSFLRKININNHTNMPKTPRIFCPQKAEFTKLFGEKKNSLGMIFPLFEFFYNSKFEILEKNPQITTKREIKIDPEPVTREEFSEEYSVIPEEPLKISFFRGKSKMDAEINVNIPFLFLVVGKYQNNEKEKQTKNMKLIHFIGKFTGSENNF